MKKNISSKKIVLHTGFVLLGLFIFSVVLHTDATSKVSVSNFGPEYVHAGYGQGAYYSQGYYQGYYQATYYAEAVYYAEATYYSEGAYVNTYDQSGYYGQGLYFGSDPSYSQGGYAWENGAYIQLVE